jgi:hypothetical protein
VGSRGDVEGSESGVWIDLKWLRLGGGPVLLLHRPKVIVDDDPPIRVRWGTQFIALTPGIHSVVLILTPVISSWGRCDISFELPERSVIKLVWEPNWLSSWFRGQWRVADL